MSFDDCIGKLISGGFMIGDTCRLTANMSTMTFEKEHLRIIMFYETVAENRGKFEMILSSTASYGSDIAATFDKPGCRYTKIDKEKFLEIACYTMDTGELMKKFHNYDMNRTLEAL